MGCWLANALLFNTADGLKISVYAINTPKESSKAYTFVLAFS